MTHRLTRVALIAAGAVAVGASPALAANLTVSAHKASFGCAQNAHYATISAAVAAAHPGDQVTVCPGTYQEQVVINKANLTLQTMSPAQVTIQAPTSLNPADNGAIVEIEAPGVKMTGFTITNSGVPSSPGSLQYGVYILDNGSGDLEKDVISNINDDPLSGDQNGVAVEAGSSSVPTVGSVTLKNDTIANYQKNGVTVDGTGSIGDIENNVITGIGPTPTIAQNGIQISHGATATVKTNTVSNNVYNGDFPCTGANCTTSTGILLYLAGRTDIEQNTLVTDDTGVYDFQPVANATNPTPPPGGPNPPDGKLTTTLNNNIITDSTFDGLVVGADSTGAQVQGNQPSGTWGRQTYGSDNGDGIDVYQTSKAQLMNNMAEGNSEDGLHAESGTSGNTFNGNQASANLSFDCEDDTGTTPTTVLNTWTKDMGDLNMPAFLCQGVPADNTAAVSAASTGSGTSIAKPAAGAPSTPNQRAGARPQPSPAS